jgi:hypothetical protein
MLALLFVLIAELSGTGAHAAMDSATLCGEAVESKLEKLRVDLDELQEAHDRRTILRNPHYHWLAGLDPYLLIHQKDLYEIRKRAGIFEKLLFEERLDDSESDAFRHFYGTLRLARDFSLHYAKLVPEIHDAGLFDLGSIMDKYNNRIAYEFARKNLPLIRKKRREDDFAEKALQWAQASPLIAVSPLDSTSCARFPAFFAWAEKYIRATRAQFER